MPEPENISSEKAELRRNMLLRLKSQSDGDRMAKSLKIKDLALGSICFSRAKVMMFYASFAGEVDTWELIEESLKRKKTVLLPWVDKEHHEIQSLKIEDTKSLVKGRFGILEPVYRSEAIFPVKEIDLIFVPGIAFDKWGGRLGRGLGFYDRFLARLSPRTVKVGLAFDFQMVESVPAEETTDVALDLIISNLEKG